MKPWLIIALSWIAVGVIFYLKGAARRRNIVDYDGVIRDQSGFERRMALDPKDEG